ncbi:MAG: hypothetical protein K6U03_03800, partial [Firmicutes bacterium]|nr:hypothetical protein [Bacillota bacterium]
PRGSMRRRTSARPTRVQVIARSGEMAGDVGIPANWGLQVGDLDDAGRLADGTTAVLLLTPGDGTGVPG